MLNVSRRGSRVSAYTRVSHSSDALLRLFLRLGRESRSLFGRGTTILCLFRSHLLFVISPPSPRGWLRIYIKYIYTRERMRACVYATFMLLSILSRLCWSRGASLSFVLFSLFHRARRPSPVRTHDPRVCTIRAAPLVLCGPRTHRKDIRKRKEFF